MNVIALQSGSNGNCFYIETGGVQLLLDAGITGRCAQSRLSAHGRDITTVDALIISHDHRDHASGMGVFHRKFRLPVYVTKPTLDAVIQFCRPGNFRDVCLFHSGDILRFGHVSVETIRTPHDAADGVAFVVDDGRHRVGVLTDLGHVFSALPRLIGSLDALIIESNYDPELLARGSYPESIKRRIRGPRGHLSNDEAAELVARHATSRLQWTCLAHLSAENNSPCCALATHQRITQSRRPVHVASRDAATDLLPVLS